MFVFCIYILFQYSTTRHNPPLDAMPNQTSPIPFHSIPVPIPFLSLTLHLYMSLYILFNINIIRIFTLAYVNIQSDGYDGGIEYVTYLDGVVGVSGVG